MSSTAPKPIPRCLLPELSVPGWSPPLDVADLATRLETDGVTPAVAAEYGYGDCWAMAEEWFPKIASLTPASRNANIPSRRIREYLKGISFGLPLFLSCVAMVTLNFSLWGGNLPIETATAVGAGTIASLINTGGFVQAMARRGLFYFGTGQYDRCSASTWFWVRSCVLANALFAFAITLANMYFNWLPHPLAALAVCFYLCLAVYWVGTGILYMLERNMLVALVSLVGIAGVAVLHLGVEMNLLGAQLISILIAGGLSLYISEVILNQKTRRQTIPRKADRLDHRLNLLWPFFAYGALYYLFLFSDRMLAWTADTGTTSLVIAFRGEYELASVLGLLAFVLQVGWVHLATSRFYTTVRIQQAKFRVDETARFNSAMVRFYFRQTIVFLPSAILLSLIIYIYASSLDLLTTRVARDVAGWALAGYPFVVFGLWNVSLLFAMSRGTRALRAIALACCVNLAAGYLASRLGGYHLAIVGFTAGAVVFAAASSRYCLATFKRLDYYYLVSAV